MPSTLASAHLTRIQLSPRSPYVTRDLGNVQSLHSRILALVPDQLGSQKTRSAAGVLYRLERTPRGHTLLIQSTNPLDLNALPVGYATATDERNMARLIAWLAPGHHIRYRLDAHPTRSVPSALDDLDAKGRRRRGKRIPAFGNDALTWWHRQAANAGLHIEPHHTVAQQLTDIHGHKDDPHHPGHRLRIHAKPTRFEGNATITDPDQLRTTILNGIGRDRAYGAGLLSIAPLTRP